MNNIRTIVFISAATILITACGPGNSAATPSADNVATIVASTLQALTSAAPAKTAAVPTQKAAQGVPVRYKNVSFTIPTGLASDAVPQTVPAMTEANGGPWSVGPEHIEFTLDDYNVPSNSFSVNKIDIYPAQAYADSYVAANISLQHLNALLSDPASPMTTKSVPVVPYFNAAPMITTHAQHLDFQNGRGMRLVTQYGQGIGPISNSGTFYNYQGLTNDGKYYVVAVLPVQAPILQNRDDPNASAPAGGIPFPGLSSTDMKTYEDYFKAVAGKLDAVPEDQFSPSLAQLDALMQSISVSP
jgi:hypothetical protein